MVVEGVGGGGGDGGGGSDDGFFLVAQKNISYFLELTTQRMVSRVEPDRALQLEEQYHRQADSRSHTGLGAAGIPSDSTWVCTKPPTR